MPYTSDLTDKQFELLDSIIPKSKTRDASNPRRQIFNGIFYQLKNGCGWRDLLRFAKMGNGLFSI